MKPFNRDVVFNAVDKSNKRFDKYTLVERKKNLKSFKKVKKLQNPKFTYNE